MVTNINTTTRIRYGVSFHCENLIEEIFNNGEDETFLAHKRDCVKAMAALLEEHGQRDPEEQAEEIVDNYEWDGYEADESELSYEDKEGNKFLLSYLGGAPLVWCIKTSKIVHTKSLCSPCVPNAADLDSGLTTEGYECYGIPDDYQEEEEDE